MAVLAFLAFALPALGQVSGSADTCPAHLFVIERSKNSNIVAYDANRKPDGEIEASKPVVAYWLLNGEKDKREELNRVERQRAYGFDMKRGDVPGTFVMTFKAGRKRRPTIRIINGCPVAMVLIGGHDGILRRMFVQSNESFLTPKVEYVEFFGVDPAGGGELYEKFVPGK
jgi:Domain of unknown function (DUF4833)